MIELDKIYETISQPLERNPEGLIDELDFRVQWLARSAEILAILQHSLDRKKGQVLDKYPDLAPSLLKYRIDSECADELKQVRLADRLNAILTHQIDAIRSILSYEKSHLTNVGKQ